MDIADVERFSAFADGDQGGNPAGVAILDALPEPAAMQAAAAQIGYSETAFAAPDGADAQGRPRFRVRYFAPEIEAPFCGHATIALGAALGARFGAGRFGLRLNEGDIAVEAEGEDGGAWRAALTSRPSWSEDAGAQLLQRTLELFSIGAGDATPGWRSFRAGAGATHFFVMLKKRDRLAALGRGRPMIYPLEEVAAFMRQHELVTIAFVHAESETLFHIRNAFAVGGVAEDPATGAAAAAFGGLLRDLGRRPPDGRVTLLQGADMGAPSRIEVEIPPEPGAPLRVAGRVRRIAG